MSEENGYQRTGKKCREKFENLYKYYRKTKEGKAGRQDGKHYRFFRQLEAIYGDANNLVSGPNHNTQFMSNSLHGFHTMNVTTMSNIPNFDSVHGLSLSNNYNSSEIDLITSSSEGNDSSSRRKKRSWKIKIKEFIDMNMERLIERQDVWLEKLTKVIEDKEDQRMMKEEEMRKNEATRIDKEHLFWAKERERMEARDDAVIEALQYLTGNTLIKPLCSSPEEITYGNNKQISKKRKENLLVRGVYYPRTEENVIYNNQESGSKGNDQHQINEQGNMGSSTSNANAGNASVTMAASTNCFPFLMGDGDQNLWESYGLKLSKGENQ